MSVLTSVVHIRIEISGQIGRVRPILVRMSMAVSSRGSMGVVIMIEGMAGSRRNGRGSRLVSGHAHLGRIRKHGGAQCVII